MKRNRVVLHPGFHKTGTTSVQRCLYENRKAIFRSHAIAMNWRFPDLLHAARGYSTWRGDATLTRASLRFAEFIAGLHLPPGRGLVISAEELAGHMPGREKVPDYGAVPALVAEYVQVLEAALGDRLDLVVYLSTRDADAWLDSAWAEHVKASRMRLDRDEFRARYAASADLGGEAAKLAEALKPHRLVSTRLEDTTALPLGPASPVVALMDLPPDVAAGLRPVARKNERLPGPVLEEMLALNRSTLDPDALIEAKRAVLSRAGSQ